MNMDYRFTIAIEGYGARDVAEDNAEALLDAFVRTHPEVGAAVGANLERGELEVTFCAGGKSIEAAADKAGEIFVEAALASKLKPRDLVRFDIEIDMSPRHSPSLPLVRRRRGADAWSLPKLAQTVS